MKKNNRRTISLVNRRALSGFLFTLPFVVGFIALFLIPVIQSAVFSIHTLRTTGNGLQLVNVGLGNYHRALFVDPAFIRSIVNSLSVWVVQFPMIIIFSFFIANVLDQKFVGRTVARSVFFLPVIITSGVIVILQNDPLFGLAQTSIQGGNGVGRDTMKLVNSILWSFNLPSELSGFVSGAVKGIYIIVTESGVQILIFLAGLQTIPHSLYEASGIDGATPWEKFWKITFPMISPLILVNSVYTVIDSLSGLKNPIINGIYTAAFRQFDFGYSAAMSWIYFFIVVAVVGGVMVAISRGVYYEND